MKYYGQSIATGGGSIDPIDKILYDRYFTNKIDGVAIECGANDGLYVSTCLSFEEIGWTVYNIEASIDNFKKLILNRPNSINYFYALSDSSDKEVMINNYKGDNGGMNSIDNYSDVVARYGTPFKTEVKTITYDLLFGDKNIDLLVLDIEGHEINALNGIKFDKKYPNVICVEHNRCGIDNIKNILHKYKLDFIDELNAIFIL